MVICCHFHCRSAFTLEPPSICRNIRAISIEGRNVNISWERPASTGRDDFYYSVEYSDGDSVGSNPVVSQDRVVTYQPEPRGDCLPCPPNTNTTVENATICPCIPGYFRTPLEGPEVACTRKSNTVWL